MAKKVKTGLLKGKEEIADFLGCSAPTVVKYIQLGMPASIIFGSYHAHTENIEAFFQAVTAKSLGKVPDDVK